ncbi:hypothetical protein [Methanopyrus kandleri]
MRVLPGSDPYDVVAVGVLALKDGAVRGTRDREVDGRGDRRGCERSHPGGRGTAGDVVSRVVGNFLLRLGYYAVNVRVTDRDGRVHTVRTPSTHADRVAVGVPLTGEVL